MPHEDYCYALERENHALNEEIESLRQQLARSKNLLKRVQEACLYTEDDDSIGITQEPHIDSQLFDDICKALAATEPKE